MGPTVLASSNVRFRPIADIRLNLRGQGALELDVAEGGEAEADGGEAGVMGDPDPDLEPEWDESEPGPIAKAVGLGCWIILTVPIVVFLAAMVILSIMGSH